MTKKPINFWDDYLNTRLSWAESTGARAQKKKTPNRVTTDGRKLPRNIYKLGDKEKYKALVERVMGMKKVLHYVGIYDTVEEAIEAQLIWEKLHAKRRVATFAEAQEAAKKVMDTCAKAIKTLENK